MKKKISLFGLVITLAVAHLAAAQPPKKVPLVGHLAGGSRNPANITSFRDGLARKARYVSVGFRQAGNETQTNRISYRGKNDWNFLVAFLPPALLAYHQRQSHSLSSERSPQLFPAANQVCPLHIGNQ